MILALVILNINSLSIDLVNFSAKREKSILLYHHLFKISKPDQNVYSHSPSSEGSQTPTFPDFSLLIPLAHPATSYTQVPQLHAFHPPLQSPAPSALQAQLQSSLLQLEALPASPRSNFYQNMISLKVGMGSHSSQEGP